MQEITQHEPIELDIITGFLGAGKTTLINKLLAEGYGGPETALLENEFGDVAIDSDLVADERISVRTMSTGCICCTLRGDFVDNLLDIVEEYSPSRIIIEPTGLANIGDILDLCEEAATRAPLRLNAVITVVSAENLVPMIAVGGDFFKEQLEQARFFLVSCSQLVDEEDLADTLDLLRTHTPKPVSTMCDDWANLSALEIMTAAEEAWATSTDDHEEHVHHAHEDGHDEHHDHEHHHEHEHEHHHEHEHGHHHHHVDEATGCMSVAFSPARVFGADDLDELTALIEGGAAGTVLRAKGFLAGTESTILYEYVYGAARWKPSTYAGDLKFVVIGRELDDDAFASALEGREL